MAACPLTALADAKRTSISTAFDPQGNCAGFAPSGSYHIAGRNQYRTYCCQQIRSKALCALQAVAKDVPTEELERAKNAAISAILINLESRAVTNEDIGRQILTYGHRYAMLTCQPSGPCSCGVPSAMHDLRST